MTSQLFYAPPLTYRSSDHQSVRRIARPNARSAPQMRLLLLLARRARRLTVLMAMAALLVLPASASAHVLSGCPVGFCNPVPQPIPPMRQLVVNGGFESPSSTLPNGNLTWVSTGAPSVFNATLAHCGTHSMSLLGGFFGGTAHISQLVDVPSTTSHAFLDFWVYFPANESDFVTASVGPTTVFSTWSTNATSGKWNHFGLFDVDVSAFRGQSLFVSFGGLSTTGFGPSIDDVSLTTDIHLMSNLC